MTITPQTLWLCLTLLVTVGMGIQVYVMAGYYHAVTQIEDVKNSPLLELSWKLVVGWSLVPGAIGAVTCLIQANTYL